MIQFVILDSGPLGLLTQSSRTAEVVSCKQWLADLLNKNIKVIVPEIIDYELRRELLRAKRYGSVGRLDSFNQAEAGRYLPLNTEMIVAAAGMWATIRQQGVPTSDPKALDIDVILAAQALSLGLPLTDFVVATSNPGHLSRFVIADIWQNIRP